MVAQIRGSSGQARETLRKHFAELQAAATRLLAERLANLLTEVDTIEADSIKPLDDCQSLIEHGVGQADELLREGGSHKRRHEHSCKILFSGRRDDDLQPPQFSQLFKAKASPER